MQSHKWYSNWFTLQGKRNRLSFLAGGLVLTVLTYIIFWASAVAFFWFIYYPEASWDGNDYRLYGKVYLGVFFTIVVITVLAIMPMMIQRIRSIVGENTGWIVALFVSCIMIPFFSIILLIWPPKKAA